MHIPDGLIPLDQSMIYLAISLGILAISFKYYSKKADTGKRLVLTGLLTAITIVATSLTIPSPMGIPMHFFIIPLVVLILGPFNASLVHFWHCLYRQSCLEWVELQHWVSMYWIWESS